VSEPAAPSVPIDVIRRELERAVDQTSLRQVAREVGLSPRGLSLVMAGSRTLRKTSRKLRDWYVRRAAVVGPSPELAAAALDILLEGLGSVGREHAAVAILGVIESMHRSEDAPPPSWLDGVRERRV
jgi:hypothetical protein